MSTHYLIDAHTSPITASQINEVRLPGVTTQTGFVANGSILNGNFVVRIPDGVQIDNPSSYTDLITQKYAGILARYPGFTNIIWDDFRDDTGLENPSGITTGFLRGQRNTCGLTDFITVDSVAVDVSPTIVTQAIVLWEYFEVQYVNPIGGVCQRVYVERDTTDVNVLLSTNNGTNFTAVDSEGSLVSIPATQEGSDLQVRFSGTAGGTGNGIFLGSWAVIY